MQGIEVQKLILLKERNSILVKIILKLCVGCPHITATKAHETRIIQKNINITATKTEHKQKEAEEHTTYNFTVLLTRIKR
jgi:hypothetical protein